MRARGKLVEVEEGGYTAKGTGEHVPQLEAVVLTSESELAIVRASGATAVEALREELQGVSPLGAVDLGAKDPREFGGRQVWKHVTTKRSK